MKNILILYISLFAVFSCTNSKQKGDLSIPEILVDVSSDEAINLSEIFDQVTYTMLSTKDSFLVGDVDRMKVVDNKLYLLSAKRLISFDVKTGETYISLRRLGLSEEEYTSLYDMFIDPDSKQIELLDMNGKKIKKYDIFGNYTGSIDLPFLSMSFTKTGENEYMLYNNNFVSDLSDCKLVYYDSKEKSLRHEYLKIDKELAKYYFVVEGNNFNSYEKLTFFSCPSNIIYEIQKNWEITPLFQISFGRHQPPQDFFKQNYFDIADFAKQANEKEYIYFINDFVENKNVMAFSFRLINQPYWSFYNKRKNKLVTGKSIVDHIEGIECSYQIESNNSPFSIVDNKFYFLLQPSQLIETFNRLRKEIGDEKYTNFIQHRNDIRQILLSPDLNDQSNPILVTCNFKQNE